MGFFDIKSSRQKGEEDGAKGERDILRYGYDKDYRDGYNHGEGLHKGQELAKDHDESILSGLFSRAPFETQGKSREFKSGYNQGYAGYEGKKYLSVKYLREKPIPTTEREEKREESVRGTDSSHTGSYSYGSGSYSYGSGSYSSYGYQSIRRVPARPHRRGVPVLLRWVLGLMVLVLMGVLANRTNPVFQEFFLPGEKWSEQGFYADEERIKNLLQTARNSEDKAWARAFLWASLNLPKERAVTFPSKDDMTMDVVRSLSPEVIACRIVGEQAWALAYYGFDSFAGSRFRKTFPGTGYILHGSDSEIKWEIRKQIPDWRPVAGGIQFISETEGYILGDTGIFYTDDHGQSWNLRDLPSEMQEIRQVKSIEGYHIVISGNSCSDDWVRPVKYESFDGGKTWQLIERGKLYNW